MNITTVLFDLDGTLLPMDLDVYLKSYFGLIVRKFASLGYDPEMVAASIRHSASAMVENDGSTTIEGAFWRSQEHSFGPDYAALRPLFEEFYREDYAAAQKVCGITPLAKETLQRCRALGLRVILATSPLYPAPATHSRIRWAGLEPEDFDHITTYEDCHYCKPNIRYYEELLERLALNPRECLMVGNDVQEDMIARQLGLEVFLLTPWMINRDGTDIAQFPHGDFKELFACLETLAAG